jgi:hypothetical protein
MTWRPSSVSKARFVTAGAISMTLGVRISSSPSAFGHDQSDPHSVVLDEVGSFPQVIHCEDTFGQYAQCFFDFRDLTYFVASRWPS